MRQVTQRAHRGTDFRGGKKLPNGYLLNARNMRFLPGDPKRIWALLGRSLFDTNGLPGTGAISHLFPVFIEGGTHQLCMIRNQAIYEADLGASDDFALAQIDGRSQLDGVPQPTRPFMFKDNLYLITGIPFRDAMPVREPAGWTEGGFWPAGTAQMTLAQQNPGSGAFTSTTDLKYLYTIYDEDINCESASYGPVTIAGPIDCDAVRVTFVDNIPPTDIFQYGGRGTHLRLYRTVPDESPGVYYRADNENDGKGIALPITADDTYDDSTAGTTSIVLGTRPADGIEGEVAWAEYGGAPPAGDGGIEYRNHVVVWGVSGREDEIIYSALNKPEVFPVDVDGEYAYYLNFTSRRADIVLFCAKAGSYLLAFMREGVFRVTHMPTYQNPGFDRQIQDQLTDRHGAVGQFAGDSFGIGEDRSQMVIYVSAEHGPMITDGVFTKPILRRAGWQNLVAQAYIENCWVQDYPKFEEVWIHFTPKAGTENTKALIMDYSLVSDPQDALSGGIRITGLVDVQAGAACYGTGNDGVGRYYLMDSANSEVYVQDSGATDAQQNYSGTDIPLRVEFPRISPSGKSKNTTIRRSMVSAGSGTQKTFDAKHYILDGTDEYTINETVPIGPGETETGVMPNATAQAHRASLEFDGATGDTYDETEATCAPCVESIEHEVDAAGRQHQTH